MFSLIITIVSIALIVALSAATMFYGGDTLTEGRERADAAAFVTGGQQISAAIQFARALDPAGAEPADTAALISGGQLTGLPNVKGGTWSFGSGLVTNTVNSADVCEAINELAGEADPTTVTAIAGTYGCITATTTFQFKY